MTKFPSFYVLLLAGMLAAGLAMLTNSPATGQDAPETPEATQWSIPDYIDPAPYVQGVWVSPDGKQVFYDQLRELTGVEDMSSYYSKKWCMFMLDTDTGDVIDVAEWIDRSLTAHYDVNYVDYSPDGKHLLVSMWQRTYPTRTMWYVLDAETKKVVGKIKEGSRGWACWLGNDRIAVSGIVNKDEYSAIRIHNIQGKVISRTKFRGQVLTASRDGGVLAIRGSRLSPTRAVAPRYADMLAIDTRTGKVIASSKKLDDQRGAWARISPDGNYVVFARSCWRYRDSGSRQYEVSVQPLNDDVPADSLTILRNSPIIPVSVTDEGNTVILTPSSMGMRSLSSLKIMNLQGMSRVLVDYNACGAVIHGDIAYCVVDEDIPYIVAAPLDTEGDMLIDEKSYD